MPPQQDAIPTHDISVEQEEMTSSQPPLTETPLLNEMNIPKTFQLHPNNNKSTTRPINTYLNASFLSKLLFIWPYPVLKLGLQRPLQEEDLSHVMETESSAYNLKKFQKLWEREVERVHKLRELHEEKGNIKRMNVKPSLGRAIFVDFLKSTWIIQPLMLASSTARIVMSLALGYLIESLDETSTTNGYMWAGIMVACNVVVLFEHHHVFLITWRKGMQIRISAVAAIFAKTLRLPSTGIQSSSSSTQTKSKDDKSSIKNSNDNTLSSGQIMNLVSNDVERFLVTTLFISYIFWAPLQGIVILILGTRQIGPAFAVGIGFLFFVFVPLQFWLSRQFAILRSKIAAITDSRMVLVGQAINGVRVMKMSGWEGQFEERIAKVRATEVVQIQKANRLKALNEAVYFVVNVVISIIIFVVHVTVFDGSLTPQDVFTIMALTNVLQLELTKHLSLGVMAGSECWVSMKRIQKFIELPELDEPHSKNIMKPSSSPSTNAATNNTSNIAISLSNASCYWEVGHNNDTNSNADTSAGSTDLVDSRVLALSNINLELRMNELTCIVGIVGSGKSALLLALAGELVPHEGSITRNAKSLAYASQDAWIMNGTVKENILMGSCYDVQKYMDIVESCGLDQDFRQFLNGDKTIVGDKGVQCSGGQRARIGLARALYCDSDVLLLDDPLAAVDSRVGRLIFYSAIQGLALKRGKCVVLVTHQHQYIGDSRCILMEDGKIEEDSILKNCVVASNGKIHEVSQNSAEESDSDKEEFLPIKPSTDKGSEAGPKSTKAMTQDETKQIGSVGKDTFLHYARCMGNLATAFGLFVLFVVTQAVALASIGIIGRWSELAVVDQRSLSIIMIVCGIGIALICLSIIRSTFSFALTIKASKSLHDSMTNAVLRSKVEFFDTNPSGRILNRFSGDTGSNDDLLPSTLFDFMMCSFYVFGAFVTAITALPYILVIVPFLLWYFLKVRRTFVTSSRELKRLEGLARSPIFAMVNENISGISTIRANGCQKYIQEKFFDIHDAHSRAFWGFLSVSRWIGFRMDSLMFVMVSVASILAVLFSDQGWFEVDPVIFGLALGILIQLGSIFQWTIRQSAEVVNQMVAVERVSEYAHLPPEAALETNIDDNLPDWPKTGDIRVENLAVRYRSSLPLSLKDVSFHIKSGMQVGIVGRTGSGKSTMVQALFRIIEADAGNIFIDNQDITSLGLHKLRKSLSVISQHPVLFSGCTVRENLDPFSKFSDDVVRAALDDVQMLAVIEDLPDGLDTQVSRGGNNFSVGERQLLCLSRAILKKSKVLVLDEPTANVDVRTDKLLQQAVKKSFGGATILSVAHRLETIIENDMILVFGDGKILEYGSPKDLILLDGHFTSIVNDTGPDMSAELRRRAGININDRE